MDMKRSILYLLLVPSPHSSFPLFTRFVSNQITFGQILCCNCFERRKHSTLYSKWLAQESLRSLLSAKFCHQNYNPMLDFLIVCSLQIEPLLPRLFKIHCVFTRKSNFSIMNRGSRK